MVFGLTLGLVWLSFMILLFRIDRKLDETIAEMAAVRMLVGGVEAKLAEHEARLAAVEEIVQVLVDLPSVEEIEVPSIVPLTVVPNDGTRQAMLDAIVAREGSMNERELAIAVQREQVDVAITGVDVEVEVFVDGQLVETVVVNGEIVISDVPSGDHRVLLLSEGALEGAQLRIVA